MPLAWADVVERNEFKGLSAEEQASAREQYFLEVVAPRVPREELAAARRQFDAEPQARAAGRRRAIGRWRRARRPGRSREDQRAPGLTPMEQLEGSVAPWRLQQVRDEAAYLDRSRGPQATPLTPAQEVVADIRDATGNPVARGAVAGVAQLAQTGIGALRGAADAVGADAVSRFAQRASSTATSVGQDATMGLRGAQKLAADVTNSILNSAPALAMGVAGGPAMRTLFAQTAAADYAETGNAAHAGIQAAAEVIGERFGFGEQVQLLKGALRGMPSGDVARVLGSLIAKEIPGEQLTTALQFLGDKVGPGARNPGATFADYLQQAGETLELTVAQTAVMGGGPAVLQTTANAQRAGDAAIARSAQPLAERAARDVGFLAPAQQRRETVRRLDDFAAQHGLSPAATKAVKQRAETLPLDQVPGYFRRALQALARRGVYRGPVDDAALAALDAPPARSEERGDRDAAVPDAGGADLRRAPSPGAADAGAAADAAGAGAAADDSGRSRSNGAPRPRLRRSPASRSTATGPRSRQKAAPSASRAPTCRRWRPSTAARWCASWPAAASRTRPRRSIPPACGRRRPSSRRGGWPARARAAATARCWSARTGMSSTARTSGWPRSRMAGR
ncbi:hypothetical protein ABXN37_22565 [Piscinibacter sakaiensis]|uniref:hypothetical protein n=1 Tax=Piscinibacter sakaiensis TaxID=1547922 RepID=UPI003727896D